MEQLQAVNKQQAEELTCTKFNIDVYMENIADLKQMSQSAGSMQPALATSSGTQLPTHQEMGSHVRLPTVSAPFPSSLATPNSRSTPPVLTPGRGLAPRPSDTGTPTLPSLVAQPSASLAAAPPLDKEEEMDFEPQEGPESLQ